MHTQLSVVMEQISMGRHGRLQEWREGRLCVFLGEVTPELSLKGGLNGGDTIWAQGEAMQVKLIDKKQLVSSRN